MRTVNDYVPSQEDIQHLKTQLQAAQRVHEYQQLKNKLNDIAQQQVDNLTEFEGAMQIPDAEKRLQTKRKSKNLTELFLARLTKMLSPRPIIGNLIALGLALFAIIFLRTELVVHHLAAYQHYMGIGLFVFAGLQIVKSGTRSLFLPVLATVAGAIISHTLGYGQTLFSYSATFYQYLMIVGIIGLGMAVLNID